MSFNEKLGFPPNAKLLIINADDFGMCYGQNIGTIRSIKEGFNKKISINWIVFGHFILVSLSMCFHITWYSHIPSHIKSNN